MSRRSTCCRTKRCSLVVGHQAPAAGEVVVVGGHLLAIKIKERHRSRSASVTRGRPAGATTGSAWSHQRASRRLFAALFAWPGRGSAIHAPAGWSASRPALSTTASTGLDALPPRRGPARLFDRRHGRSPPPAGGERHPWSPNRWRCMNIVAVAPDRRHRPASIALAAARTNAQQRPAVRLPGHGSVAPPPAPRPPGGEERLLDGRRPRSASRCPAPIHGAAMGRNIFVAAGAYVACSSCLICSCSARLATINRFEGLLDRPARPSDQPQSWSQWRGNVTVSDTRWSQIQSSTIWRWSANIVTGCSSFACAGVGTEDQHRPGSESPFHQLVELVEFAAPEQRTASRTTALNGLQTHRRHQRERTVQRMPVVQIDVGVCSPTTTQESHRRATKRTERS
ncbi:Hypothetical predicted protein [Scomber scombrus]|uniref:Uncharacterized protein n=1 Tax=Scomber scombrus TaxID=13677 RepID=A0AAV1QDJ5_SCOSC